MNLKYPLDEFARLIGFERNTTSHREKLLSAMGAAVAITCVAWVTYCAVAFRLIDIQTSYFIVASMGASAVLLFAVPHGSLSQPWSLVGGHMISAVIGIACQRWLPGGFAVAGLAVGLAVGVMYYLRCIHPPGGATALTSVIGADAEALGYQFLLVPILVNLLSILFVALLFNNLFHWRRYPAHLAHRRATPEITDAVDREHELTHEDFAAAMQELDSYVDVTAEGLADLLELAKRHAEKNTVHPERIVAGKFYSNGKLGKLWSVCQVLDDSSEEDVGRDLVIYKIVAGAGAYDTGLCSRGELRSWARFEVEPRNGHWVKV